MSVNKVQAISASKLVIQAGYNDLEDFHLKLLQGKVPATVSSNDADVVTISGTEFRAYGHVLLVLAMKVGDEWIKIHSMSDH